MATNTKAVGERAEGQVLAALLKIGKVVLLPFGDNQRYDLVVEEEGHFIRIQCKSGRLRKGVVRFNACSTSAQAGGRRSYKGEADLFGVYCPDTDKVYLVPIAEVDGHDVSLRQEPPRSNQKKGIRLASEYELKLEARLRALL